MKNKITFIYFLLIQICFCQFGQNILQYEKFEWKYIQTKYFDIYFYEEGIDHSKFVNIESDKAYEKISNHLNWELKDRYTIIIHNSHNDFQQTNVINTYMQEGIGGVTELYKNRIVIPFDGSIKDFKHVIHHEMVHLFINDMLFGGSLKNMVYSNVKFIPLWMNEGLSEFLAEKWNVNSEMWARDIAINSGDLPNMNQLNGYLAYRGGHSIWKFITTRWGDEIIANIFWELRKKGDLNLAIKSSIGTDLEGLFKNWHAYLKEQYWSDIKIRDNLSDLSSILIDHSKLDNSYNIAPSLSPSGEKFALYSNKSGNMSIYLVSTSSGKFLKKILEGETTTKFEELHILKPGISWSPDGEKIVFSAKSGEADALFILNIITNKTEKIDFDLEGIFEPVWNPNNKNPEIAFIGNNGKNTDIYIYNYDTTSLTNITNDWFSDSEISWSIDGNKIYFISNRGEYNFTNNTIDLEFLYNSSFNINNKDIYKIDKSSRKVDRITNTIFNESYPVELKDEKSIIFLSDKSGINNLYIIKDHTEYAITNTITGITQFSLDKNNNQILLSGLENLGYNIYRITDPIRLIDNTLNIPTASWRNEDLSYKVLEKIEPQNKTYINKSRYQNFVFDDLDSTKLNSLNNQSDTKSMFDNTKVYNYDKPKFTLDFGQINVSFDMNYQAGQGMVQMLLSDIMGNHRIYVDSEMEVDFENSDYMIEYHFLPNKIDWHFRFYHYAYFYYDGIYDENEYYYTPDFREQDLGILIKSRLPLNRFNRYEIAFNFHHTKQTEFNIYANDNGLYLENESLSSSNIIQPYIKYVHDNTKWNGYHPISGSRLYFKYRFSPKHDDFNYYFRAFTFDVRTYKNFDITSIAYRLYGGKYWGNSPYKFKLGGVPWIASSSSFDRAYSYGTDGEQYFSEYVYPIRGIPLASRLGDNVLLINFEYRLPMLLYYLPTIKWLGQLNGVIFTDIGVTWNKDDFPSFNKSNYWGNELNVESSIGWSWTYGFGPRFIFLGLPWQLDYTWQYYPLSGKSEYNGWFLSIGLDF